MYTEHNGNLFNFKRIFNHHHHHLQKQSKLSGIILSYFQVPLEEGLVKTVEYFREELRKSKSSSKRSDGGL